MYQLRLVYILTLLLLLGSARPANAASIYQQVPSASALPACTDEEIESFNSAILNHFSPLEDGFRNGYDNLDEGVRLEADALTVFNDEIYPSLPQCQYVINNARLYQRLLATHLIFLLSWGIADGDREIGFFWYDNFIAEISPSIRELYNNLIQSDLYGSPSSTLSSCTVAQFNAFLRQTYEGNLANLPETIESRRPSIGRNYIIIQNVLELWVSTTTLYDNLPHCQEIFAVYTHYNHAIENYALAASYFAYRSLLSSIRYPRLVQFLETEYGRHIEQALEAVSAYEEELYSARAALGLPQMQTVYRAVPGTPMVCVYAEPNTDSECTRVFASAVPDGFRATPQGDPNSSTWFEVELADGSTAWASRENFVIYEEQIPVPSE